MTATKPKTCDFRDAHDPRTDRPIGQPCGKPATHRIEWEDGRYSYGCDAHLEIDASASVRPICIRPLAMAVYGFDITYVTTTGEEKTCHYTGFREKTVCKKAMLRAHASKITKLVPMTEKEYTSAFGRGRM